MDQGSKQKFNSSDYQLNGDVSKLHQSTYSIGLQKGIANSKRINNIKCYGESGNFVIEFDGGKIKKCTDFNEDGSIKQITKYIYTYSNMGLDSIFKTCYDSDEIEIESESIIFDKKKNQIALLNRLSNTLLINEYYKNGNIKYSSRYSSYKPEPKWESYFYNRKSKLILITGSSCNDYSSEKKFSYDEDGRIVKIEFFSIQDDPIAYFDYNQRTDSYRRDYYTEDMKYNESGDVLEWNYTSKNETIRQIYHYEYDLNGNWVKKTILMNSIPRYRIERIISYAGRSRTSRMRKDHLNKS